ncbi:MAG: peptidase S49 [Halomonas sp. 54_146]|nr:MULTISPECIES: S49 family peptidase [unclassified Halomonas]KUJ87152.1 MAG: peptidase S49 [Halomonas sp. 54_146]HAA44151.1 S49 family peptidase [Halomonas sp.]
MTHSSLSLVANHAWLITGDALDTLMAVADRQGDIEALESRLGSRLDNTRAVTVRNGVAVVPVTGPIFRYANLLTAVSGATSTQVLATDLQAALDDPSVKAIVLDIDSPGGEATGINELGDLIYQGRSKKPIKAYVSGMAASAAYWFASSAEEVVVDDTAQLGSVGVVLSLRKREDRPGEKSYEIVSSNAPNKRPDLETEAGRAQLQTRTDELANVFLDKVSRNRNIPRNQVNDRFRQGGIATGALAVQAGMADRLGSLESLIAELGSPTTPNTTQKVFSMTTVSTTQELQAALQAGTNPRTITVANGSGSNTLLAATQAERTRCLEIYRLAGAKHQGAAANAIRNGTSIEAFGHELFQNFQSEARNQAESDNAVAAITKRWEGGASNDESGNHSPQPSRSASDSQDAVSAITQRWQSDKHA